MHIRINNNKGMALVSILIVFIVLFILGVTLLQVSLADTGQATWQSNRVQAHYLARSGVEHGIKFLEDELDPATPFTGTITELVAALNGQANESPYAIDGVGTYTVGFTEGEYAGQIKILSTGTVFGNITVTQTVTYTKELTDPVMYESAAGWLTGINLQKKITPSVLTYLGHAVLVEAKNEKSTIQSPKGGDDSWYQASIIAFNEYRDESLRQVTQSIGLKFDAEIILFKGYITLNKDNDPLVLTVTPTVLRQKTSKGDLLRPTPTILAFEPTVGPLSPASEYEVGFENEARYLDFIKNVESPNLSHYLGYNFAEETTYGVTKLGNVYVDKATDPTPRKAEGYYFFPPDTNLQDSTSLDKLIRIEDGDPIIEVLDKLFMVTVGTSAPFWNDK